ncbi:MAG: hypothetical protein GXP54_05390 [Deltaproteobacteria bacterium]|nr:hypothetical protein [Deltaproteobacteria bacterium]
MKPSFESIQAAMGRMTPRERRLFGILAGVVALFLVGAVWLFTDAMVGSIEEEIDHGRKTMAEIRRIAPRFREASRERKAVEAAIRANQDISVRVAANEILKKIELVDDVPGATGSQMSDVVSFEGKTTETPVELTGKKKKKKKKLKGKAKGKNVDSNGIVMVEQKLEFRDIPWANLEDFLDRVQSGDDLLFVTRLELARKFNKLSHVRATVTIASYRYQDQEGAVGKSEAGR